MDGKFTLTEHLGFDVIRLSVDGTDNPDDVIARLKALFGREPSNTANLRHGRNDHKAEAVFEVARKEA